MKASVVICVRNEEDTIEECIKSLINQDYSRGDYEVIVVDDASTDKTPTILEAYSKQIRCFRNKKNMGRSYSRNLGIRNARGKVLCFIDGDAYADRAWLTNITAAYEGVAVGGRVFPKEILGGVGGFVGVWNKENPVARYSAEGGFRIGGMHQGSEVRLSSIGFATLNTSYPRRLVEEVGGFDESLVVGGDTDLNLRIMERGYVFVYNPRAKVYHMHPASLRELAGRWFGRGRYHNRLAGKYPMHNQFFARMINPRDFAMEAVAHLKTPAFILIDVLVRISFMLGWALNKLES